MAEAMFKDSFPPLKELENKVGRKTPESLLVCIRDAECDGDGARGSDVVDRSEHPSAWSDGISDKISCLKREMRWLRSADVRILCQLVTVHEGIEAVHWLMDNRGALASRSSSLTGSLSSLVTVEESGPWNSPCSSHIERVSPTCPQDLTETTGEESEDPPAQHKYDGDSDFKNYINVTMPKSSGARLPCHSNSNVEEVICSTHSERARALTSASLQKSEQPDVDTGPLQACRSGANTIRRALLRSSRVRRELNVDTGFFLSKQSGETQTEHRTKESFKAHHNSKVQHDQSTPDMDKLLVGYDAQWCWVDSQDDVTFL
ncbi:Leucine rich adaptor protein 1 Leucine repeat adapter protein 35A [Channa argus]|uniref:Leucine rich adaptor protein 1 Leucine repeat adapter protein 35A n=1 Tax=Channa argus TaxID=215402 RepID=A0A6G1Q9E8_CHAAH|nr:Leucine rich adaptor protein 1 Leucine repeat adapter protein 35A [Channa argus]